MFEFEPSVACVEVAKLTRLMITLNAFDAPMVRVSLRGLSQNAKRGLSLGKCKRNSHLLAPANLLTLSIDRHQADGAVIKQTSFLSCLS